LIQHYLRIGRRWIWLLLLATLAAGATGYAIVKQQSYSYRASARVIIGPGLDSPDPNLDELRTAGMLMQTYAELVTARPILEKVVNDLGLDMTPDELSKSVTLRTDDNTRILAIHVEVGGAVQAVRIANAIADTVVSMGPVGSEESDARIKDQTRRQIGYLEQEIVSLESTLAQLEQDYAAATNREEKRLYNDQIALRRAQLAEASNKVIALDQSLLQSQTNQVRIIEPAVEAEPVEPEVALVVAMTAIAGLILALVIVFGIEYVSDMIRSEDDLAGFANLPLLGVIAKHKPLHGAGREQLVAYVMPESRTVETYRLLASKLILSRYRASGVSHALVQEGQEGQQAPGLASAIQAPIRSLLISGTNINGARSSEIAANLAVVLAQTGLRVILVDANLHQPDIGRLFGASSGRVSLSTLLAGQQSEDPVPPVSWLPTLSVLPSGPTPAKSFDLLASPRMTELIHELEGEADLVLIAASPLLLYADSLILASRVDGVVVVVEQGATRHATLVEIVESLKSYGATTLGLILDQSPTRSLKPFSRQGVGMQVAESPAAANGAVQFAVAPANAEVGNRLAPTMSRPASRQWVQRN